MPSFGGSNIFGEDVRMRTSTQSPAIQRVTFFGLSGTIQIFGGARGRQTVATGTITGTDPATARSNFNNLSTYQDGIARTLVDTDGVSWSNVVLDAVQQNADSYADIANLVYCIPYQMVFSHLI